MRKEEYSRMAEMETIHWWYRSLHAMVLSQIRKQFESREINIIDAGCGTGGLISYLRSLGYLNIDGFDISDIALRICDSRNIPVFKGNLKDISKYYGNHYADVIISNDTFYFLNLTEQRKLTNDMYELLRENGLIIINMPSIHSFRGIHDLQVGINKRVETRDIWDIFDQNKYELLRKIYWPFMLSPMIWMARYTQRLKMLFNPNTTIRSDLRKNGSIINSLLFSITDLENNMLANKPFGSSLFLVMKKK